MEKRMQQIEARKAEILEEAKTATEERLKALNAEADTLAAEMAMLETRKAIGEKLERKIETEAPAGEIEKRAKDLRESRAVTMATTGLVKPVGNSKDTKDMLGSAYSAMVDLVDAVDCEGMSEYKVAYVDAINAAAKATEATAATDADIVTFGYASIKPVKVSAYNEVSHEVLKQTDSRYYETIRAKAIDALRKKLSDFIMNSDATSTRTFPRGGSDITGAIAAATDLEITAIDATTLRKIALSYGGDENIVGAGYLMLNKKDLVAFGDVRGTNEKRAIYEITPDAQNPNTGVIRDGGLAVRYTINSNVKALADATAGDYIMVYGVPRAYQMGIFSQAQVRVAEDLKKDVLQIRADIMAGGNVVVKNGFVRVKKKSSQRGVTYGGIRKLSEKTEASAAPVCRDFR